jgi:hypothetical protein
MVMVQQNVTVVAERWLNDELLGRSDPFEVQAGAETPIEFSPKLPGSASLATLRLTTAEQPDIILDTADIPSPLDGPPCY